MTLFRSKSFFTLTVLTLCAASAWYTVKHKASHPDSLHTEVGEQQSLQSSPSVQSHNPFASTESLEVDLSTSSLLADNGDILSGYTPTGLDSDTQSSDCGVYCMHAIEMLKQPFQLDDHEYEELTSQSAQLATYLQANPHLLDEFIEIAVQADGNKRKIVISAFNSLPESDRLVLGQALIQSRSARHRLDGINVLADTKSSSQQWVNDFSALLDGEPIGYVRQSVVQALNRPEFFQGDPKVLSMLSHIIRIESDESVRGEALLVSARLAHDPQSLLTDSFRAVRSAQSEYQHYGVLAIEEIFSRHTRVGGEISEADRYKLERLVSDIMKPEFDNMSMDARNDIENLFERFL